MSKNKTVVPHRRRALNSGVVAFIAIVLVSAAVLITAKSRETTETYPPTKVGRVDELNINLTNDGFVPTEITHSAGAFGISVENKSSANEYTLKLKAQDGTTLNEIPVQKGSVAWSVDLPPGLYTLTEANHEQWTCVITVQ